MQQAGYETICIGKWDVSDRRAILDRMPLAQGFDHYFGPLGANDNGKVTFHKNNEPAGGTDDMGSLTQLYDLEADIGETQNLAETYPERVEEMQRALAAFWNNTE